MAAPRRKSPGLRESIIAITAVTLAIVIGGSVGLLRQAREKKAEQEHFEQVKREREQFIQSELAKNKLTPETIESDQLLYYEGLRLLLHRHYERSAALFEILPKRFPASPYIAKVKKLEPYALASPPPPPPPPPSSGSRPRRNKSAHARPP